MKVLCQCCGQRVGLHHGVRVQTHKVGGVACATSGQLVWTMKASGKVVELGRPVRRVCA